jgi:hypothetical protein
MYSPSIYEARYFVLSLCDLPNHGTSCHALGIFGKLLMNRGAPTWFETVWSYGVEAIDYWTMFSMKWKTVLEFEGVLKCCWKALSYSDVMEFISQFSELRCGRHWFWRVDFVAQNSNKLQKWKNQLTLNVFTLPNIEIFNSENVKNKKMCSHLGQGHVRH